MLTIFETNFQTAIKYVLKIQKKCIFPAFRAIVKWGGGGGGACCVLFFARIVSCSQQKIRKKINSSR